MLSAVAAAVSLFPIEAQAQSLPKSAVEGGRFWFVELAGPPVADGAALASVLSEKATFRRNAASAGARFNERFAYHTLFNGFSIEADAVTRLKLLRLPGLKAIYPFRTVQRPATVENGGSVPNDTASNGLIGADVAQNQFVSAA